MQRVASSAVTWCKSVGGKIPKDDLVSKLSTLAASGKHPQNAERDLQRCIGRFGRRFCVQVDFANVRLHDPKSSAVYTASLPILCPISLAKALWCRGQDVFEAVFLGHLGKAGARSFWKNAKKNCDWFPAGVQECDYEGLLPLSLYGDDVQAYRNSDPGAVSVVGWSCDFGYKNSAMIQTFLACVYSEYCACEHTYNDILEHLLPKFREMADPGAGHEWHAGGFRFILAGVRGDLKWLNVPWATS